MQLNSLLVLSVALLFGARHPTPTVVLVPQTDAIRTALPGAKQFFVRTVTIGQDDLARIRKDIDYSPQDPNLKVLSRQTGGRLAGGRGALSPGEHPPWTPRSGAFAQSGWQRGQRGSHEGYR